ncbi:hypothetical protein QBC36DRAFT_316989 [Triangularia setosa]|uniref:Secreted protein n=1 Tax=Triangularia setosa TaxID=2587417 RepID=A0AAN6WH52_9PEZI|nr:hypothetical protein QBC36DRAFT_316989 [Podospora setosa]
MRGSPAVPLLVSFLSLNFGRVEQRPPLPVLCFFLLSLLAVMHEVAACKHTPAPTSPRLGPATWPFFRTCSIVASFGCEYSGVNMSDLLVRSGEGNGVVGL